jgi:hypothetical protein
MRCPAVVIALILFTTLDVVYPQTPPARSGPGTGGTINGLVKDSTGAVLGKATVTLTGNATTPEATPPQAAPVQSVQTQDDGTYVFRGVAPGTYTVSATYTGLTQSNIVAVMLKDSETVRGDITMKPAEVVQQITVEENPNQLSVDPSQNADALVIKGAALDALPDDPDDLQQDLQALAGPSAGPNGGQIFVDGFSSGRLPPKDSIREIRINQNPFSSEYDTLGYGRIEIFTKPGSDSFHGTAFFDTSQGIWNSRNPFLAVSPYPNFQLENFGGNVSGPLTKHTSFFVDFERRQIDDNALLNAIVLAPTTLTPYNDRGFTPTPQQRTTFSPRIDYQLSSNNTLSLRYSFLDLNRDLWGVGLYSLPGTGYTYNQKQNLIQLTDTAVLSTSVVNETRYQYHHDVTDENAQSTLPEITVPSAFVTGGATVGRTVLGEDSHEFQNYTTITHGTQTIKFGARVRGDILNSYTPTNFNGTYTFASFNAYQITEQGINDGLPFSEIQAMGGGPTQFSINTGNPSISSTMVDVGTYVQDDWRIRPNLTISAGLRWEGQTNIHDWHDFGPRASFAWAPKASSGNPKFVIRGGFGMFYIRFPNQDELYTQEFNGVNQQSYLVRSPGFFYTTAMSPSMLGLTPESAAQFITASNLRTPYLIQSALSVERQLARRTTLSVNWTDTRGVHQFVTSDINAPLPSGLRPLANMGDIFEYQSDGLLKQMQVIARINTQVSSGLSLFGAYVWNNAHSNTDGTLCATTAGCGTSEPVIQNDLSAEWSRSSLDIADRMFLGGTIMAPWKVQLAPFMTATSGLPFDITTGGDYLDNGILNARPAIATGPGPGIIDTPYGYLNPNPLPGEPLLPRNYGTGPAQFNFNLRLSRTWGFGSTKFSGPSGGARANNGGGGSRGGGGGGRGGFGGVGGGGGQRRGGGSTSEHRYNLTLSISARNLINHVNDATPVGVMGSPFFLEPTAIAGGFAAEQTPTNNRRIDIQLRFQF